MVLHTSARVRQAVSPVRINAAVVCNTKTTTAHECSIVNLPRIWNKTTAINITMVIRHDVSSWVPSQYPQRRLFVRSRKVSKPRDWYFKLSYRFEIWQAHRQHCCRSACQISERSDNSKYTSRGFETLLDLTKRRLFGYWDGAQVSNVIAIMEASVETTSESMPSQ